MRKLLFISMALAASSAGLAQEAIPEDPIRCDNGRIVATGSDCVVEADVPGPYIVFFDWGGLVIPRDYTDLLDQVAKDHRTQPGLTIHLVGHSDRSGPANVNRRYARQRALVVRDALIERGVDRDRLEVGSSGEAELLISTADDVREAQNRRVEISFSEPSQ